MEKEEIINKFIETIKQSWTYDKLTLKERKQLYNIFNKTNDVVKGTFKQKWAILQAIYTSFLGGCGYDNFHWREKEKQAF